MITTDIIDEVRRMLREGRLSQRKIAERTGVSRGTVNAVASGKRVDYSNRPTRKSDFTPPRGLPTRCPSCGGLVRMPCLVCYLRGRIKSERARCHRSRLKLGRGAIATASRGL